MDHPPKPGEPGDPEGTETAAMFPTQPAILPTHTGTGTVGTQVGTLLKDRYLIVRELSRGGFGKVFLAYDQQLHNRPVVVKVQLERPIEDPWYERKFAEELRALALIDHPGVVGILDNAQTLDGRPFLVMQYVEGKPLRAVLTTDGLALDRAANIVRQIGQALGAAHDKKIWHRDLKPENIMLQILPGGEEHVRLIDFGIATIADLAKGTHTRVAGSVAYMAPEQFSGQPSAATDIYAFGVIAYEIITGRKPFVAEDAMQLSLLQRTGVRLKPSALRPGISSSTEKLILHALSYNPNDRPVSAPAFGEALSSALLTSQSTSSAQLAAMQTRRTRLWWVAGAAALVLALAAGGLWIYRGRNVTAPPVQTAGQAGPAPAPAAPPPAAPQKSAANATDEAVELAFWNSIGSSSDPRLYREYLAKYPNGKFASLAKLKLEEPAMKAADGRRPAQPASAAPGTPPTKPPAQPPSAAAATALPAAARAIASAAPAQPSPGAPGTSPAKPPAQPPKLKLSPLRPALKAEDYGGPLRGALSWAGTLEPGATLIVQGGGASAGSLTGDLPRVPISVEAATSGVALVAVPSAANQWDQVVVKNTGAAPLGSIQLRWRVAR